MLRTLWRIECRGLLRDIASLAELIGFVVLCLLIFSFVSSAHPIPAPLVLWITILFGGILYLGRSFDREWASDGSRVLEGMRMIPGVIRQMFWIKWIVNCLVLLGVALIAGIILGMSYRGGWPPWFGWIGAPLAFGIAGIAALGTLFAVGTLTQARREYLLPLLCYPIAIPLILGVSQCLVSGIAIQRVDPVWLKLTAGCSLLYVTVSFVLFPFLVEE